MNIIKELIIKQAYKDKFTEAQLNLLKKSRKSNYDLYLVYKKIYSGKYEIEE